MINNTPSPPLKYVGYKVFISVRVASLQWWHFPVFRILQCENVINEPLA